jgi:hypothetical protein
VLILCWLRNKLPDLKQKVSKKRGERGRKREGKERGGKEGEKRERKCVPQG